MVDLSFICISSIGAVNKQVSGLNPIELAIEGDVSNINSLNVYSKAIDYLFRGVTNFASGKIMGTSVKLSNLGSVVKNGSTIKWDLKVPKSDVVTYLIDKDKIKESMYFADAILSDGQTVKPLENKGLLKLKQNQLKDNLLKGVVSLGNSKLPYYYTYEKNRLILKVKATDSVIDIDNVVEDDVFIALKLLNLYMSKAPHMGILLLNASGFSDATLEFIVDMHKIYQKEYGVSLLFIYNKDMNSKILTDKVYLPDIER